MIMGMPIIKHSEIRDVQFGENVTCGGPVNLYECKIGDNSFVGPFVEIQRSVEVGAIARSNHIVLFAELVTMVIIVLLGMASCSLMIQ
jgi:carbonic anhydrase/acetyltransferase-like protein (isoleucine patch superfamily)